jgi:hypothetical protein
MRKVEDQEVQWVPEEEHKSSGDEIIKKVIKESLPELQDKFETEIAHLSTLQNKCTINK